VTEQLSVTTRSSILRSESVGGCSLGMGSSPLSLESGEGQTRCECRRCQWRHTQFRLHYLVATKTPSVVVRRLRGLEEKMPTSKFTDEPWKQGWNTPGTCDGFINVRPGMARSQCRGHGLLMNPKQRDHQGTSSKSKFGASRAHIDRRFLSAKTCEPKVTCLVWLTGIRLRSGLGNCKRKWDTKHNLSFWFAERLAPPLGETRTVSKSCASGG
jgi:hypothetical protein